MVLKALFQIPENISLEEADILYITKYTLRFGDDVYQCKNVTGFGIGEIKQRVPILLIFILFVIGFYLKFVLYNQWGSILLIADLILGVLSLARPKQYGLQIYLNSGDKKLFVTSDIDWIKQAVRKLYYFMEKAPEGSSMTIEIGGNIQGNIIQGSNVEGRNH
ncbi:DUF6232 family protein [Coleofasciculus sp. E1-EBD-02]|uniref:DUF6232 family protein n=1 Tax=Coleofasciculus sp. E1-EBD-02 TaxID=3068481 RepID=UPI0032F7F09B